MFGWGFVVVESLDRIVRRWRWAGGAVVGLFVVGVLVKIFFLGGLTQFAGFGEYFEPRYLDVVEEMGAYVRADSGGYDGQFYAQIATDPLLRNPKLAEAIDEPAYRARRILLPAVAYGLALGDAAWAIRVYSALNIVCWFAFAWLVWRWIGVADVRGFARWVGCVASLGVLDSVKYSLVDLPSVLLILVLIRYARERYLSGGVGLAAGILLKETNVLAAVALPVLKRPWVRGSAASVLGWGVVCLLGLGVFAAWYWYVHTRFDAFVGVRGNFDWPFASMGRNAVEAMRELVAGNWDDRYVFRLLALVGFWVQLGWLLMRVKAFASEPLVRMGLVYGVLFLVLGDLVWHGYWAVARVVLPMTLAFNLLLDVKGRGFWVLWSLANITVIHAVYRFI